MTVKIDSDPVLGSEGEQVDVLWGPEAGTCFHEKEEDNFEEGGYVSHCLMFDQDDIEAGDVHDEHNRPCCAVLHSYIYIYIYIYIYVPAM